KKLPREFIHALFFIPLFAVGFYSMIKSLRPLLLASMLLPLALPSYAAVINTTLPPKVQQALKASKLGDDALLMCR
ncbi:D-alanyl-D-alanine carboxypeptidase/D-alanyl-D-alanine-endopeptidase, partial [Pseudomonas syringae pv. maculicola]